MNDLVTDLDTIKRISRKEEDENWEFRTFLKIHDWSDSKLDAAVHEINRKVSSQIDCQKCGNCCATLRAGITRADSVRLANRLLIGLPVFQKRYVETDDEGDKVMNQNPCPFLEGTRCSVYEDRPESCRSFPHLHKPRFRSRLIGVILNTSVCPIVFNVLRELKRQTKWRPSR
ncbi:MAG: YkgJ family cysteine cluster protein [Fimbriimonadales bacterium]